MSSAMKSTVPVLSALTSKATSAVLGDCVEAARAASVADLQLTALGGVDVSQCIRDGAEVDLVFLSEADLTALAVDSLVETSTIRGLFEATLIAAVAEGAAVPDLTTDDSLRAAMQAARAVGYSSGPSGLAVARLVERWELVEVAESMVRADPGVPVGALLQQGQVDLGFQQLSELLNLTGIRLVDVLAPSLRVTTIFGGAVRSGSSQPEAAAALLDFFASPALADLARPHGLVACSASEASAGKG